VLAASAAGIKFGPGWSSGNDIIGNTITSNTCGTAGNGTLNTYKDNMFTCNTTDICPQVLTGSPRRFGGWHRSVRRRHPCLLVPTLA